MSYIPPLVLLNRANHVGSQAAATISDLEDVVPALSTRYIDGGTPSSVYGPEDLEIDGGVP